MSSAPDRKAELAEKRKKLEAVKKQRLARQQERQKERHNRRETSTSSSTGGVQGLLNDLDLPAIVKTAGRLRGGSKNLTITTELVGMPVSLAPVDKVSYAKSVQTDFVEEKEEPEVIVVQQEEKSEGPAQTESTKDGKADAEPPKETREKKVPELSDEQKTEIMNKEDFISFFDRSTKIVERVLHAGYDPTTDYSYNENDDDSENAKGDAVSLACEYFSERFTTNRVVTAMNWSPKHPELMCAAYNANPNTPNDPDGLVMVWNANLPTRPEYRFECQSSVLSVSFCEFSPHIIAGGTYSGQVVLWDNRSSKRTPVQRSNINSSSHTHPVFCLSIVGTQNSHQLVTTSTDGKMCSWDLDTLAEPLEHLSIESGPNKPIAGTCFSFPAGDSNNFVLGSEDGCIFQASRHGAKAGLLDQFTARDIEGQKGPSHHGPVTGVDFFKATNAGGDFSHLFLSSSIDWTVKLWSYRNTSRPLYTFDNSSDYVYDVKWSPVNPAVFACGDGMGYLDVWNLNQDLEQPITHLLINEGKSAINRLEWSADGKKLGVGTAIGKVCLFDVSDRVALPRMDEVKNLETTISDIRKSNEEAEVSILGI